MAQYNLIVGDTLSDQRRNLRRLLIELGIWQELWGNPTAICIVAPPASSGETPDEGAAALEEATETFVADRDCVIAALPLPPDPEE